jgi:GTPase SAR1 family protein
MEPVCLSSGQLISASGAFLAAPGTNDDFKAESSTGTLAEDLPFVCAIIGAQGSGKSTLLNDLFHTDFPVLDASRTGPRRTTEGIFYALLHLQERGNSLLILDVEGLDSKERGSTGRHFEYNVAFFVAYTADIVILNVFSHDIGRQNAATFHALVTVLREKFKLVESSHKKDRTLLLVAIRDFDEVDAPIDDLKQALEDDFHALWPSVVQGSDIKMEELYDIQFYGLPSKLFETARFEEKVDHMRKSIMDRWLRTSGGLSSSSSFLMLFKELWTEISNRTSSPEPLCISATASLVELLIDLHCTRIIQYVMGGAREKVHRALSSILENFSDEISVASLALEIHDESILKYRWMARHYVHSPTFSRKETELHGLLWSQPDGDLANLVRQYWFVVTENRCRDFEADFASILGGTADFEQQTQQLRGKWASSLADFLREESQKLNSLMPEVQTLQHTCMERFENHVGSCIDERRRQGAVMLPTLDGNWRQYGKPAAKKGILQKMRPVLLRILVIYLNYLQAKQRMKSIQSRKRRCDLNMPLGPTF